MTPAAPAPADVVARLRAAGCVFAEDEAALLVAAAGDARRARADGRAPGGRRAAGAAGRLGGVLRAADRGRARGLRAAAAHRAAGRARRGPAAARAPWCVDLCCGTGAVGAAVAGAGSRALEVYAADVDPAAVACARRNLPPGPGPRGRPLRRAARPPARPGRRAGRQRAVRADRRDRADAAGGPRPRAPGRARRRRRRPRRPAPGRGGRPRLAGARRARCSSRPATARPPAPLALLRRAGLAAEVATDEEVGGTVVVGRRRAGDRRSAGR